LQNFKLVYKNFTNVFIFIIPKLFYLNNSIGSCTSTLRDDYCNVGKRKAVIFNCYNINLDKNMIVDNFINDDIIFSYF